MAQRRTEYMRSRIERLLDAALRYPLAIVSATAGYGKTTAVREHMLRSRSKYIWISLTCGSEFVFWDKLCSAVSAFSAEAASALTEMSVPQSDIQAAAAASLIREHVHENFVLVIDDYHLLPYGGYVNSLIKTLTAEEIPFFHIVLISRSTPDLDVTTLIAKELCFLITTREMAFTDEETEGYLSRRGLRLTKRVAARMCSLASGWISAIFLLSEGVRNGLSADNGGDIEKLMDENFLGSLDGHQRSMLVQLSAIGSFTAGQAEYVLGDDRITAVLNEMVRLNAFVTCDASGRYHFHNLLREYLRKKLSDGDYTAISRRSASWLKSNGDERGSLETLLGAGAVEDVLTELNKPFHPLRRIMSVEDVGNVFAAMDNEHACIKYPFPYLHLIFFSFISGIREDFTLAAKLLPIMEEYFKKHKSRHRDRILGECRVIHLFADKKASIAARKKYLSDALQYLNGTNTELLFRDDASTMGLPTRLYGLYMSPGTLDIFASQSATVRLYLIADGLGYGSDSLLAAEAALERCDIKSARLLAREALVQASDARQSYIAAAALFTLMRADLFEGDSASAVVRAEEIRKLPEEYGCRFDLFDRASFSQLAESASGYMYACLGKPEKIPLPLKTACENGGLMYNGFGFFTLIRAKSALISGHFGEAEAICATCSAQLETSPSQLGKLNLNIVTAAVKNGLGEAEAAISFLTSALEEAGNDGIIMPFAENARCIMPILNALAANKHCARPDFPARVIRECRKYIANCLHRRTPRMTLTTREQQVLRLAASGKTQREIAAVLEVTAATAKKHLISAYKKLGAENRISAVKTAEALGLI